MENPVIENIKSRRSVRDFQDRPIPDDVVNKIIEAGTFAPSALNRQPWQFIVIQDPKTIRELSGIIFLRIKSLYPFFPLLGFFKKGLRDERFLSAMKKTVESGPEAVFYKAPLLVAAANDTRFDDTRMDCSFAAQNMMLAAGSYGIGSCFIGRGKVIPKKFLQKRFGLPAYYDFNVWVAFGYPMDAQRTAPPRKADIVRKI